MIKPNRLVPGDTIGIVSPSWGGAGAYPHRVDLGIKALTNLGFQVELAPHALNQTGFTSDTPANRVRDILDMFASPTIKAIIAAIGGDHSCHLLPLLDFELISQFPKVFMGFSDITVLNVAIWKKTGMITFNGPALLTDFAEFPHMFRYTEEYFLKCATSGDPIGKIEPSPVWTEEFLDWGEKKDLERPRQLVASTGWTWLKEGQAKGHLIGGCLESLQHLRGTEYWPEWDDAIFFFEPSEGRPTPETIDGILMDYQNMGVLDKINGMIIGRPMRYSEDEKQLLRERVLERTHGFSFPIITDMDFGHTSPQFTIPLGCLARINTKEHCFEIIENAVV